MLFSMSRDTDDTWWRMIISVQKLTGDETLGGALPGEALLSQVITEVADIKPDEMIVLDFKGIQIATFSYLRSLILGLRSYCGDHYPKSAIVVANTNPAVIREIEELLSEKSEALVVCDCDQGKLENARVIGSLDTALAETLKAVINTRVTTARQLAETSDEKQAGTRFTKWNNRLAALVRKGILAEETFGKSKEYRPILEDLEYGN